MPHVPRTRVSAPASPAPASVARSASLRSGVIRLVQFGLVGGVAFVVDVGLYNLLRATVLDDKPIGAKVASVAVATLVAWLGNRHLTFRAERSRPVLREAFLFGVMNVIGLGIAAVCLYVSHYVLGFRSQLADNIAGNGVGLVLGMTFRFLAYRYVVFSSQSDTGAAPEHSVDTGASAAPSEHGSGAHLAPPTTRNIPIPGSS